MRQWRMGTLTLGLILIALGCGFILSKLGIITSIIQVLSWWPLALILLGVEVLFGGFLFTDERCKLKFDGFSVLSILLILLICAGSFTASFIPWNKLAFNFPHSDIFYKDTSVFQKQLSIDASGKDALILSNNIGSVQLQKSSGNKVEVEASIKISHNDYEYAKSIPDTIIKVNEGKTLNISSDIGQLESDKANLQSIEYKVKVPEKFNVEINNKFGKIDVENLIGNAKINNTNGAVSVKSVAGDLIIDNKFGDITIFEINGTGKITNSNGKISASGVNQALTIENKFGDVSAANIKGNLKITDNNGKVKAENTGGTLTVDSKFGGIEIINVIGFADIKNENGSINFVSDKINQNDVKLQSKFGNITLSLSRDQQGIFNLFTRQGNIKSEFPLSINKNNTSESTNSIIGNNNNKFDIKNENGSIVINKN